jgi:hypothetical protein
MPVREQIQKQPVLTIAEQAPQAAELDLVIPFTTPELTRAAINAANRMGAGLNAALRLVRVQVVPFELDLHRSPVFIDFLKEQLAGFESALPMAGEVRLARDFEDGLKGTLGPDSVVILATKRRLWRTNTERLSRRLRRFGYRTVLVGTEAAHA